MQIFPIFAPSLNQFIRVMQTITENTPIAIMTAGQLRDFLGLSVPKKEQPQEQPQQQGKRLVYGLAGIQQLFNVSHVTAQRYKDSFLAPAISQQGRKIVVDADEAIRLFKEWEGNK